MLDALSEKNLRNENNFYFRWGGLYDKKKRLKRGIGKRIRCKVIEITLYQGRAVFGKMKMDPAKRAQTQNAVKVSWLQWFFSYSVELMADKVWLHCIRPILLKERKLICCTLMKRFSTYWPAQCLSLLNFFSK